MESTPLYSKIIWGMSTQWYTITEQLGYPRPQGNLSMMNFLSESKQNSLMNSYLNVLKNENHTD